MSDSMAIALLSLVGTLGGTFGGIVASSRLTTYRIKQLELRVEKHNNVIERTYVVEESIKSLDQQLKILEHVVFKEKGEL